MWLCFPISVVTFSVGVALVPLFVFAFNPISYDIQDMTGFNQSSLKKFIQIPQNPEALIYSSSTFGIELQYLVFNNQNY